MGAHLRSMICLCTCWVCVCLCTPSPCMPVCKVQQLSPFPLGFFREMVFPREAVLTLQSGCSPQDPHCTEQSKQQQP